MAVDGSKCIVTQVKRGGDVVLGAQELACLGVGSVRRVAGLIDEYVVVPWLPGHLGRYAAVLWKRFRAEPALNHSTCLAPNEWSSRIWLDVPSGRCTMQDTGSPGERAARPRRLIRSSSWMRS